MITLSYVTGKLQFQYTSPKFSDVVYLYIFMGMTAKLKVIGLFPANISKDNRAIHVATSMCWPGSWSLIWLWHFNGKKKRLLPFYTVKKQASILTEFPRLVFIPAVNSIFTIKVVSPIEYEEDNASTQRLLQRLLINPDHWRSHWVATGQQAKPHGLSLTSCPKNCLTNVLLP